MRNFHEQRTFQLKPIINRANERVSVFQIQKSCFVCSIPQQKPNSCKDSSSFVQHPH